MKSNPENEGGPGKEIPKGDKHEPICSPPWEPEEWEFKAARHELIAKHCRQLAKEIAQLEKKYRTRKRK